MGMSGSSLVLKKRRQGVICHTFPPIPGRWGKSHHHHNWLWQRGSLKIRLKVGAQSVCFQNELYMALQCKTAIFFFDNLDNTVPAKFAKDPRLPQFMELVKAKEDGKRSNQRSVPERFTTFLRSKYQLFVRGWAVFQDFRLAPTGVLFLCIIFFFCFFFSCCFFLLLLLFFSLTFLFFCCWLIGFQGDHGDHVSKTFHGYWANSVIVWETFRNKFYKNPF